MEIKNLTINDAKKVFEISVQQFGEESWTQEQYIEGIKDNNYIKLGVFEKNKLCIENLRRARFATIIAHIAFSLQSLCCRIDHEKSNKEFSP